MDNIEKYRLAVGALLLNKDGNLYVFRRIDYPDNWQAPEGGVDEGENNDEAIYREIQEEIGIAQKYLQFITKTKIGYRYKWVDKKVYWDGFVGQEKWFYLFRFTGNDKDLLQNLIGEKEFNEWKIVTPKEILNLVPSFKKELYSNVLKEFNL